MALEMALKIGGSPTSPKRAGKIRPLRDGHRRPDWPRGLSIANHRASGAELAEPVF
jgi:hypothetical protein